MPDQFRHNHYVPQWYQRRFIPPGQQNQELFYRDLKPEVFLDVRGVAYSKKEVRPLGLKYCFAEDDLYTTKFGSENSTDIERLFFGEIDRRGASAIDYFTNFNHSSINHDAFRSMIIFMSTQKLRTPKGLGLLSQKAGIDDRNLILGLMVRLRNRYCAIWSECVWQIANASQSGTKFIISDHPVTVYNRKCGPRSQWCIGFNDPEIWLQATHTLFPLSPDKVLILTNLSWVRNPYQSEVLHRPNSNPQREAIFRYLDVQIQRQLTEQEVREINFIIKSRALNYIAAGKEEWLYPENYISKSNWNTFGDGYLLMPDPRPIHPGGELLWGNSDGSGGAMDEYGRTPLDPDFSVETNTMSEFKSLERFKGEFARRYGPYRRGRSFQLGSFDPEKDTEEMHKYHLSLEKKHKQHWK